jgi:predicted RNA methylase
MELHPSVARYPVDFANSATQLLMLRNIQKYKALSEAISKSVCRRTVLDIGTGSGVLALLSAANGARKVVAVDRSPVDAITHAVCDRYLLGDKIEIRGGDLFDLDFKGQVFDVIISETIGYLGFEENIHNLLLYGRQRLGHDASILIPSHLTVMLEPVTSACAPPSENPYLTTQLEGKISAKRSDELQWVDLGQPVTSCISIANTWQIESGSTVGAVAVYFNARLADSIYISNKTDAEWPHCVIPLRTPLTVSRSAGLNVSLSMSPNSAQGYNVCLRLRNAGGHLIDHIEFGSTDIENDKVLPSAASIADVISCADSLLCAIDGGEHLQAIV